MEYSGTVLVKFTYDVDSQKKAEEAVKEWIEFIRYGCEACGDAPGLPEWVDDITYTFEGSD